MRLTRLSIGALTLLLLIAVPVNAAPALQKGSQASYNLSVSISFLNSCKPILSPSLSANIMCPMFVTIPLSLNITGTVGWTATKVNSTITNLNVTRDLTSINGETLPPAMHHPRTFNESINLATRIASILPFIEPEMDQALQMAQTSMATTLPLSTALSSTASTVHDAMMRHSVYTMWWVNGPIDANDTIPVLVFPTNVTGSTSVDLGGSLGTRTAWTLAVLNNTHVLPPHDPLTTTSAMPIAESLEFAVSFNYDQTSDLLLSATADIHFGFDEETTVPCDSTASTSCPSSGGISVARHFGFDIQATLKLVSTNLDLSQRVTPTDSSKNPTSDDQSNTGSNPSTGPTSDHSGTGPTSGLNPSSGSGPTSGSGSGSTGPASGSQQPTSNSVQSKPPTQSASLLPWILGILGVVAAVIVAAGVWIARRRMKKAPVQVPTAQSTI